MEIEAKTKAFCIVQDVFSFSLKFFRELEKTNCVDCRPFVFFTLWREEHVLYDLDLFDRTETINELLARYGVKFGIYKNNEYNTTYISYSST